MEVKQQSSPKLEERLAELAAQSLKTVNSSALEIGLQVLAGRYELVRVADAPTVELPTTEAEVESIVEAVLAAGVERRQLLDRLKAALLGGEQAQALMLARELCNLQQEEAPVKRCIELIRVSTAEQADALRPPSPRRRPSTAVPLHNTA